MPKYRNTPIIRFERNNYLPRQYFYHNALEMPFGLFLFFTMLIFFGINFIFSLGYYFTHSLVYALEPQRFLDYSDSLYFSLTFPVIGFGGIIPVGWGKMFSSFQIFCGLLFLGFLTGLIFARFSKARSPLVWSSPIVLHKDKGRQYIQVRVTNVIGNDVVNVAAQLFLLKTGFNKSGEVIRTLVPIPLEISTIPITAFSWILSHPLTPRSPLWNWIRGKTQQEERIVGFVYGYDSTIGKDIYSYSKWSYNDLAAGAFQNIITHYREDDELRVHITMDLSKIDEIIK